MKREIILFTIIIVLFGSYIFSFVFTNKLNLNAITKMENIRLLNTPIQSHEHSIIYNNKEHNIQYITETPIDKELKVKENSLNIYPQVNILALSGLLGNITTVITHDDLLVVGTSYSVVALNQTSGKRIWSLATTMVICINVTDFDRDGKNELIVIMTNKTILLTSLDGTIEKKFTANTANISAGYVADINNDGFSEIIIGSVTGELIVLNSSFNVILTKSMRYSISCIVAKRNEIIVGNNVGYITVMNSSGYEIRRFFVNNGIKFLDIRDIDGDDIEEIIAGTDDYVLSISDSLEWQRRIDHLEHIAFGDADDDGRTEILACNNSHVYILSSDGLIEHEFNMGSGIHQVFVLQRNTLAKKHLVLTANRTHVLLINVTSQSIESKPIRDEVMKITVNDIDNDGDDEFLTLTVTGLACGFELDLTLKWISSLGGNATAYTIDLYNDNTEDILLAYNNGIIELIEYNGNVRWWTDVKQQVKFVDFYNFDSDPYKELCITLWNSCQVIDDDGTQIWNYSNSNLNAIKSFFLSNNTVVVVNQTKILYLNASGYPVMTREVNGINDATVADVNGDKKREVIVFLTNGSIICFNENNQKLWSVNLDSQVVTSFVIDINQNSRDDVLCTTKNKVYIIENGMLDRAYNICNITKLAVFDFDLDNVYEIFFSNSSILMIVDYLSNKTEITMTEANIVVAVSGDISGDNKPEIILARDNFIEIYNNTEKILSKSLLVPLREIKIIDFLADLVCDILVETDEGLYLIKPTKIFKIIEPKNDTWISTREIHITYSYWGFVPSEFIIYLNGSETTRTSGTSEIITTNKDGTWILQVVAVPMMGESVSDYVYIHVDTTPPELNISITNNSWFASNTIIFEWNASDNFSGIDHFEIKVDNGSWIVLENTSIKLLLTDGHHVILLKALDNVGNTKIVTTYVNIDTKAPLIEVISPGNNTWFNESTISIEWNTSDKGIGVKICWIQLDDGPKVYTENNSITFSNLSDGIHTVRIGVIDYLDHENSTSLVFFVDTKPPRILIKTPNNGTITNNASITLKWTYIEENLFGFYVKIDNNSWNFIGTITSITLELTHGGHWLYIKAIDYANNTNTVSVYVYIDLQPPKIIILSPANNTTINTPINKTLEIKWNITDDTSVVGIWISIDYGNWIPINLKDSYTINTEILEEGYHVIRIKAKDYAGNIAEVRIIFYITKPPPPKEEISSLVYIITAEIIVLTVLIILRIRKGLPKILRKE